MVLNYFIRHNLTQQGLVDLLSMLNVIFGVKQLPERFKSFNSAVSRDTGVARTYFCSTCKAVIGKSTPTSSFICNVEDCGGKQADFFITIPMRRQIEELLSKYKHEIESYSQRMVDEGISDVTNAKKVRELEQKELGRIVTLSVNTDGAAAYKWSSNKPCYPIFVAVNNLPPRLRFDKNNLILTGIWLSQGEPYIPLFFKDFSEEARVLGNGVLMNGVWTKLYVVQCCADSVARPKLQNVKQYNGKYGCSYCLQEGTVLKGSKQIKYPFQETIKRNVTDTRKSMVEAHNTDTPQYGIKGLSIFMTIPYFDVVNGFPPDYMHGALLGVTRQLWELFSNQ
ncbi:uncharacterized protein LOC129747948 [Uranotaenia lowii]|uniref:uncharacterized protein LOC129747948 n=1 Tax=Uranotaenia lowii TaxID=190385 RepID=UPI002478B036|nr:uncharacterized protein LOC129747948 [Uranotaenia lowii]